MADYAEETTEAVYEEAASETVEAASTGPSDDGSFVGDLLKKIVNLQETATGFIPEGKCLAVCMAVLISIIIIYLVRKLTSRRRKPDKKKTKQQRKESTSDGKKKV